MRTIILRCLFFLFTVIIPHAGIADNPYEFDWDSRNDMRGAWVLCSSSGFVGGNCPQILEKCWQAPMIYFIKLKKNRYKVATYCVDAAHFSITVDDVNSALTEAKRRVASGIPFSDWE
ncbi:MAG: hypothetical protein IPP74_07705 [Alphaproteobacteria bacterium]|nr:hypothetical protein [Alphaproteobacteria bacterium]